MDYLDWTLPTPEENLVCEEVLLDACERTGREVLRFWELPQPCVVAGYGNRGFEDVDLEACRQMDIPVLARHSGGGTVLLGHGSLNYALVLTRTEQGPLEDIRSTNTFIMERLRRVMSRILGGAVTVEGHSDLALSDRKFSGNAQYRRRGAVLFHGTLMLDADIGLIDRVLRMPPRAPDYRRERGHREFLTNIGCQSREVKDALREEFQAGFTSSGPDAEEIRRLAAERFSPSGGRRR